MEHFLESVRLLEEVGDRVGEASSLNSIGIVYCKTGRLEEGLAYYRRSLALYQALGSEHLRPAHRTLNNLGVALKNLGRYAEAEVALAQALAFFRAQGEGPATAAALNNLARVYEGQGRRAEAEAAYREALDLAQRAGHPDSLREALLGLGRLYLEEGRLGEARPPLEKALALAPGKAKAAEAQEGLYRLAKAEGRTGEALAHLEAARALEREAWDEAAKARLHRLQLAFEVEAHRKEAERERASKEALRAAYEELTFLYREREEFLKRLERESLEDPLTGLHNRRYLDLRLAEEFVRARRFGHPLALILADIDNFKRINDTFSHAVGDKVLKAVAQLLREGVRETDLVVRYGGEEFVVVLLEAGPEEAYAVAEKLRTRVETFPWGILREDLRVTLSLGVACDLTLEGPEELLV